MARIRVADTTDWSQSLTSLLTNAGHQVITDPAAPAQVEFIDASSPLQGQEDVLFMVVAAPEQVGEAIERCKAGAYAFIRRPFIADEVELLLERALDHQSLAHENHELAGGSNDAAAPTGDTVAVARTLAGKPLADIEKQVILSTLEQFKGHRVRTATALGIGVRTLGMKLKRWRDEGEPIIGRMTQSQRPIHVNT